MILQYVVRDLYRTDPNPGKVAYIVQAMQLPPGSTSELDHTDEESTCPEDI